MSAGKLRALTRAGRSGRSPRRRRSFVGRALRWLAIGLVAVLVVLPVALMAVYRFVPVPITPLMVLRLVEGEGLDRRWVSLDEISPHVAPAVLAAEDNLFCSHAGIDWEAVETAWEDFRSGGRLRGASTVSMQTAKNLFLWPDRSWVRKGLEAYLTVLLELAWDKRRIIEVYLNIAEWGPGIYGIEAAARHHFGVSAADLSPYQSALLAVSLPNPRAWSAGAPTPSLAGRAQRIARRVGAIAPLLDCY